jgi:hypothetical protein
MALTLSLFAGAGAQFFDNTGNVLSGGKIYTYQAGTTTPLAVYTSNNESAFHTNPIILDAAGRVPSGGEIWLQFGVGYKFVLKTSTDVLIATYDNIPSSAQQPAANDADSIFYEQGYTVTAGSFISGKIYRIVSIGTTDFTSIGAVSNTIGLHFIATGVGTGTGTAELSQTVETKLRETVSVKDFGAVGDGATDDTAAIVSALATGKDVMISEGTYRLSPSSMQTIANQGYQRLYGEGNVTLSVNLASSINMFLFNGPVALENLTIDFNEGPAQYPFRWAANAGMIQIKNIRLRNLKDTDSTTGSITFFIVPTGNTFDIQDVSASSMLKRGNGNITDGPGSYNVIYVGGGSGSTQGSIRNVFVSEIHNINASDQIIYEDTAGVYVATESDDQNNRIEISNVHGYNFGKRLLKIHASNVAISNVTGYSIEGDSLGVIGFNNAQGLGEKYGNTVESASAFGLMEIAFSSDAPSTAWKNLRASVQPGTKAGMINGAFGLLVNGDDTLVDGFWSDSQRDIGIGSTLRIVKNTTLKNINLTLNSTKAVGCTIHNTSTTLGFDGLLIDGVYSTVSSNASFTAPIYLWEYTNGTTKKGRNLTIKNVTVQSAGPLNSQGIQSRYNENVSIETVKYINTSGLSHFRICEIVSCSNVNVDDVVIEGVNQIGVQLNACTGRNTVGRVYNPSASAAAVYNNNSTDVWVYGCDQTQVSGATTATPQSSKQTSGNTASRPTTGLVAGYSQHFDTTLGKPIWWDGSVWKDAAGTTV